MGRRLGPTRSVAYLVNSTFHPLACPDMRVKNLTPGGRYDLEHYSRIEDIQFWLKMADRYGSPILDIGSGTGRTGTYAQLLKAVEVINL